MWYSLTERVWFPSGKNRMCKVYYDDKLGVTYINWGGERLVVVYGGKASEIPHYSVKGFMEHEEVV